MYRSIFVVMVFVMVLAMASVGYAQSMVYTTKAQVNLREKPFMDGRVLRKLDQNETLTRLGDDGDWVEVTTLSGKHGFVHGATISSRWIKVLKQERTISVMDCGRAVRTYTMALCPFNPLGDKAYQGDGGTPEGRFFVCESIRQPTQAKYGARSMRLSYPSAEDARRGLKDGRISYDTYKSIILALRGGRMPSQSTPLGSSLRIHGGGNARDWTLGCIGMADADIREMFDMVPAKVRVDVYKSEAQEKSIGAIIPANVLKGANAQLAAPALYSDYACGLIRMSYPGGDIRATDAVCTDVVVRALRHAGLDLQALLHEDILTHPERYRRWASSPNTHIDHRRTRNLHVWLSYHAQVLPVGYAGASETFLPGDILTMDTGIINGTPLDHIGIVHTEKTETGVPLVFNIWNTGERTSLMKLIGDDYPVLQGHFRLAHPYEYL